MKRVGPASRCWSSTPRAAMPSASMPGWAGPWPASSPNTRSGRVAGSAAPASTTAGSPDRMDLWQVAGALASALLHAGWNAAVKASPHPTEAMTAQMVASAAIVLPGLLWTGLPAPASRMWIAASTALNVATVTALLRAYELFGFGLVYPVVRALSVLLVVPLAAILSGETLSPSGLVG